MITTKKSRFVSRLTRNTLALVLAGGRGSRLYELTDWRAKPAVSFGGKFRLIDFPLSNCVNSGIRRIGVLTQYKAHSLIRHLVANSTNSWKSCRRRNAPAASGTRGPPMRFIKTSISCAPINPSTC
jgi:ADP-glucose pyrophosphorylase